jgi:hypothetical protein
MPNPAELRVGEDGEWDESPGGRASGVMEKVLPENLVVVVRDVGERRPAVHIAEGVHAGHVGFQPLVDRDEAPPVNLNACRRQVQAPCARRPPGGDQKVRPGHFPFSAVHPD